MADTTHTWLGTTSGDWATASNWTPAGPPAAANAAAVIDGNATAAITGSDQSATTLDTLRIKASNTYAVGSASTKLKIGVTDCYLHEPSQGTVPGSGAGRINLQLSTAGACNVYVLGSSNTSTDTGKEPIRICGGNATTSVYVSGPARLGLATDTPADTMTLNLLEVTSTGANVTLGEGATWVDIQQTGGNITVNTSGQTIGVYGGTLTLQNGATANTVTVAGKLILSERTEATTNTFTSLTIMPGGELVLNNVIYVGAVTIHKGGKVSFIRGDTFPILGATITPVDAASISVN